MPRFVAVATYLVSYAAILLFAALLFHVAFDRSLPEWTPTQYLLAMLILVAWGVGVEIIFHPIAKYVIGRDRQSDPLWRRGIRVLILLVCGGTILLAVVVIGKYFNV